MPAALIDSLERHNAAFERLLALIPAKHYIRTETDQDQVRLGGQALPLPSPAGPDCPHFLVAASTATST